MSTPRFLADECLNHHIVSACLRVEPAIDFLSSLQGGLAGLLDPEVLALAAASGRILVTHDFQTMPGHFADFIQGGAISPGVLLVNQRQQISVVADCLILIWSASEEADWENRIIEIPL